MAVTLVDSLGSDLSIVNAARESYDKRSDWDFGRRYCLECKTIVPKSLSEEFAEHDGHIKVSTLSERDAGLVNYLMKFRHGTPFEFVQFHFHIVTSIAVAREWMRHRIGSYNERSTRYVEMGKNFYVPEPEAVRCQVGKPGHYTFEQAPPDVVLSATGTIEDAYSDAYSAYLRLLDLGVAKELARNVLPLGTETGFYWSVNLRSLFNFLSLRTAPDALLEIRMEAQEVEKLAYQIAPISMTAWNANGRLAP